VPSSCPIAFTACLRPWPPATAAPAKSQCSGQISIVPPQGDETPRAARTAGAQTVGGDTRVRQLIASSHQRHAPARRSTDPHLPALGRLVERQCDRWRLSALPVPTGQLSSASEWQPRCPLAATKRPCRNGRRACVLWPRTCRQSRRGSAPRNSDTR